MRLPVSIVRSLATHLIRQKMAEPAIEPAPDVPCEAAMLFALELESGAIEDRLADAVRVRGHGFELRRGTLRGRSVVVARTGAGAEAGTLAAQAILDGHRPRLMISAGFAGGLHPNLERCDLVVADRLVAADGRSVAIDLSGFPPDLLQLGRVQVGPIAMSDRVVRTPDAKASLAKSTGAIAVDMESLAVAEACRAAGTPFFAVRAITDAADDTVPRDVEHLLCQKSLSGRLGAAIGSFFNRPGSAADLFRLRRTAMRCSELLAKLLSRLIAATEQDRG